MWKRNVLRSVPVLSRLAKRLDALEADNQSLKAQCLQSAGDYQRVNADYQRVNGVLQQLIFDEASLLEADPATGFDEPPIPPAALRFLVAGTDDLPWFRKSGQLGAQALVEVMAKQGKSLRQLGKILDFGCGCGRVLRCLKDQAGDSLHGADPNVAAIRWCQKHLGFAEFRASALEPPLPYSDAQFGLIYAFSIFTHLTETLQMRWMAELGRILAPGGYLVVTVHGDKTLHHLSQDQRDEYRKGRLVTVKPDLVGANDCVIYHPEAYVRRSLARDFEVIDFIPEGAKGNPPQDLFLLKK